MNIKPPDSHFKLQRDGVWRPEINGFLRIPIPQIECVSINGICPLLADCEKDRRSGISCLMWLDTTGNQVLVLNHLEKGQYLGANYFKLEKTDGYYTLRTSIRSWTPLLALILLLVISINLFYCSKTKLA